MGAERSHIYGPIAMHGNGTIVKKNDQTHMFVILTHLLLPLFTSL